MPAELKGSTKFKVPEGAKPGDEIELKDVVFIANQDDFDRSLRTRLEQQQRKHDTEKADMQGQLDEANKKASGTQAAPDAATAKALEKLAKQNGDLQERLAKNETRSRIEAAVAAAGLTKMPKVYRASLDSLKVDASDSEINDAVAALVADPDLKKILTAPATIQQPAISGPTGRRGAGGSTDAQKKLDALRDKMQRNRPELAASLDTVNDEAAQIEILESWDAQKQLEPKKP